MVIAAITDDFVEPKVIVPIDSSVCWMETRLVIVRVHMQRLDHLAEVAGALDGLSLDLRLRQCGEEHRRQNADDGNYDQKLD